MSPRIVAVSGPLKGAAFPISESELSIGRDTESDICLSDPLVSRRHCAIRRSDETIRVVDLESTNGTWVNGSTVREKELHHDDWVKIGTSQFVFLERDDAAEKPPLFSDEEEYRFTRTMVTTRLGPEDVVYLQPEKLIEKPPAWSRMARDLSVLLRVSTSINAIRNAEELQHRLMELIFEVIPAQRIAILLVGQNSLEFTAGTYRVRGSDGVEPFGVSRTVTHQVLREGVALMSNDVAGNAGFDSEDNLNSSGLWSVLCVPLTVFEATLGVIYSDTTGSTATFDADHLQLLTAIASVATVALEHVRYVEWIEGENQRLQEEISLEHDMVGDSHKIRQVYNFINRVAASDSTVLIRGESGTGKELVARAIHRNSRRAAKPFVAVNCAAIVETLLESELFGHERGAFTGAVTQRRGKLETADGGTVFLDEVGELALPLQAALLRVIQEREFERVGGTRPIRIDVRIIAATNRNLDEAIKSGKFRQDLFYRLNVVSVTMPALRERREDIPLLVSYFVQKYRDLASRSVLGVSPEVYQLMLSYDWPGNVRELQNVMERAMVLGSSEHILVDDLPEALLEGKPADTHGGAGYHEAVNQFKKKVILDAFQQSGKSYTKTAKSLGLHPNYLHRLIRNLGIKDDLVLGSQGRA